MFSKSLTELANLYGTDKGTTGPSSRWGAHNYTDIYEAYLGNYRQSPVVLLEIGLGVTGDRWNSPIVHGRNTGGASLKMWHDYFPKAKIYGIDINECLYLENSRTRTFVADQGRVEDLDAFVEATGGTDFDIIIDDGSHRPDHQQISFSYFFRKLKSGGLYFIEDLLSNGMGDGAKGIMASDKVRNTRSVMKHYLKHGSFLEPNAFLDPDYLRAHIGSLSFHVPDLSTGFSFRPHPKRLFKKVVSYHPDSESLCAIRKK
ncbi:MAG: hypothetical protein WAV13_06290 [Thermodesulfovibrionales bacterium]